MIGKQASSSVQTVTRATVHSDIYRRLQYKLQSGRLYIPDYPGFLNQSSSHLHTWGLECSVVVIYAIRNTRLMTVIRWWSCIHHFCPGCTGQMDPDHPSSVRDTSVLTAARVLTSHWLSKGTIYCMKWIRCNATIQVFK